MEQPKAEVTELEDANRPLAQRQSETQRDIDRVKVFCEQHGASLAGGGLAYSGSIAYGLDSPESDIDLRGFALPSASDILMLHDFGTLCLEDNADASVHSLSKICSLLLACNPTVIELLGVRKEHVLIDSHAYKTLREHSEWFVSRRCGTTFGGYASQQLRRIENSMNREVSKEVSHNAARSIASAMESIPERYPTLASSTLEVVDLGNDLALTGELHQAGFADLRAFADSCNDIVKNASNLAARNRKKTSGKLSKHASHLIRLLRMGSELLETGAITTWRGEDRNLLLEIKQGKWLTEAPDGTRSYDDEFWALLDEEEARFNRAKRETSLPAKPDEEPVQDFIRDIHRKIVRNS